jgi:hypothetical protein
VHSRQIGDRIRETMSLGTLARLAYMRVNWTDARMFSQASLEIANELGDRLNQSLNNRQLGDVARAFEDSTTARGYYQTSLERAVQLGHRYAEANALYGLAHTWLACRDCDQAASLFSQGMTVSRQVGLRLEIEAGLEGFGALAALEGERLHALHLVGAAAALRDATGAPLSPGAL